MRALLLLLLLLAGPLLAQDFPVEVKVKPPGSCRGCDCPADYCYSPACDCTLPVTQAWAQGMLCRIVNVLKVAYPNHLGEAVPVKVKTLSRLELGSTGGEPNFGLYGDGLIRVSNEVPRREAVAILAHEYGHAWQFTHHPDAAHVADALVEGFAEWVAYQSLKRLGDYDSADRIKTNVDPIYGGGFRWFYELEHAHGVPVLWEVALGWLDLKGNRVASVARPSEEPIAPPAAPSPTPAPTNTGGFWMSPKL